VADGTGWVNGAVPLAFSDWGLAIEHLGEGERYYKPDPTEARRLLAEAGYPNGFATVMDFNNYGSSFMDDAIALILRQLKTVGIDAKLNTKEYGAYIATSATGNYEAMYYGATPFLDPDNYLYTNFAPGHPRNVAKVNDSVLTDLLVRQRRTADPAARRALIHDNPAPRGRAAIHRRGLLAGGDLRVGRGSQELRAESRVRLRWPSDGGLARPMRPSGEGGRRPWH